MTISAPPDTAGALTYNAGTDTYSTDAAPTADAPNTNTPQPTLDSTDGTLEVARDRDSSGNYRIS